MKTERVVNPVESSVLLILAFETSERAGKVYEKFRDGLIVDMHRTCLDRPSHDRFFMLMQQHLGLDHEGARREVLRVAKTIAILELTAIGKAPGKGSKGLCTTYESAGKAAWTLYWNLVSDEQTK